MAKMEKNVEVLWFFEFKQKFMVPSIKIIIILILDIDTVLKNVIITFLYHTYK